MPHQLRRRTVVFKRPVNESEPGSEDPLTTANGRIRGSDQPLTKVNEECTCSKKVTGQSLDHWERTRHDRKEGRKEKKRQKIEHKSTQIL